MSPSLSRRLAILGSAVVLAALVGAGLLTGMILHLRAVQALDEALLAAAHAHVGGGRGWEVEHSSSPVQVWVAQRGDSRLSEAEIAEAAEAERPQFLDREGHRLLLLPAESERHDERHIVIAARAPVVTLARSVGSFAAIYAGVAALAALGAAGLQRAAVRLALRPLDRAAAEARLVGTLASGDRLTEGGPEEIARFLRSINALLDRLDAAQKAQSRFSDQAAHELRTPIAVLRGELEIALRRPRSAEEYQALLCSLTEEVARIGDLVEGLLALARLDAGALPLREELLASEIATSVAAQEEPGLHRAGSRLELVVREDALVQVHRALLESALANLLRNAARHAPGTEVRLGVEAREGQVFFAVEDQGPGIAEADREAVFDRLSRGSQARRTDRQGLGLGLPLAREVARRHGGTCLVEAAPGGGCRAVLTISSSSPKVALKGGGQDVSVADSHKEVP